MQKHYNNDRQSCTACQEAAHPWEQLVQKAPKLCRANQDAASPGTTLCQMMFTSTSSCINGRSQYLLHILVQASMLQAALLLASRTVGFGKHIWFPAAV